MKETLLAMVKNKTIMIARATQPVAQFEVLTNHPFVSSIFWYDKSTQQDPEVVWTPKRLDDPDIYEEWVEKFAAHVDSLDTLSAVYALWRGPYKLSFMKYCGEYLGEKDYGRMMADAWVTEENPNMDVNVSRKEALRMFRKAKKEHLMDPEELAYYQALPEELDLYRGVAVRRTKLGLSWTDDEKKARWFMQRFDTDHKKGQLLKVHAKKDMVLAFLDSSYEKELVLDVFRCRNAITRIV